MKPCLKLLLVLLLAACSPAAPPAPGPVPQPAEAPAPHRAWWKEAVVYQVYPRSFKESDGDGVGDLQGHHLRSSTTARASASMSSGSTPSSFGPNDDNGYDISDYRRHHEGVRHDAGLRPRCSQGDATTAACKMVLDLVVNHSSDEHEWFKRVASRETIPTATITTGGRAKREPPPNNWPSFFDGTAWELDKTTGQYYLHYFSQQAARPQLGKPEAEK